MRLFAAIVLALTLMAVPASGVVDVSARVSGPDTPSLRAWASSPTDASRRLARVSPSLAAPSALDAEVYVDPDDTRQQWLGTGAALTDASTRLLDGNGRASRLLFHPSARYGARLDLLRLPLSPTDFSPSDETWAWDGTTVTPSDEAERAASLITGRLARLQPRLRVLGSPWTAPASMKTTGSVRGGWLRDDQLSAYGSMLVGQVDWLRAQGVPLGAITLGNEPGHASDYPSMLMGDAQMTTLADQVGPELRERGVGLWAVDHNWADQSRYLAALGGSSDYTASAFHCYRGTPAQMALVPGAKIVTECTGTTGDWPGTFDWDARNLIDGAIRAGSSGLMMWNLALDRSHGPLDAGSRWGCKTCRGVVTVDGSTVEPGPEFYALAHLARAAGAGSSVVDSVASPGLSTAAFRRPDGSVGVLVQNASSSARVVHLTVEGRASASYEIGAHEFLTVRVR